ncbi:nuclear transport factor 2 family protein [Streptomyces melanogenes]|uniref:Nuclear transport factor 2 family protein n=1 Tax=Streptomyces melanogenes TaxID=67326 RepID=A0ABZ1XD85_9ACTN|nr:nuclear transport factor 2 family protein [Streptomyces melanogenes]
MAPPPPDTADGRLYDEIQRFYARQVRLLGDGDVDRWALTFTEDAVFEQEAPADKVFAGNAPPVRTGRAAIAAAARGAVGERRADGRVRRYLIGMLTVRPAPDGAVHTRYDAVLVQTPRGGPCELHLSTTGRDELVRRGDGWLVRHRVNSHDSVAGSHTGTEQEEHHGRSDT